MAKFARDIRQDMRIPYPGWPETKVAARREFAVAICESGSYYPTADSPRPAGAFAFLVTTHQLDSSSRSYTGKDISIAITDYLTVIEVVAP